MGSQHKLKAALVCLLMTMALSGCGGGGGGGSVSTPVYPPPATIFSDSFADGTNWSSRWTPENDTGGVESWNVVAGVLLQSTTLEVGAFEATFLGTTSYHLGTYARLVDPALNGISNYRFSVGITPLTNVPPDREGNDVGIMFRYQNPFSYYRVSMNARYGFTRFEKRVGNTFETLAVNAIGYDDGLPITMTAEVNGNTIIVWIDGEPVFAVVDSSIPSGTVALYCQDRAQFDNVRITENPTAPVVAISSPLAYSIDTDNSFTAQAVVLNLPVGGSVAFSLDDGSEISATGSGNVYSRVFNGVTAGNHKIAAIVRDANGTAVASDTNLKVGTGGDYYVTVGNSITNGTGDGNSLNNISSDGRIVAIQGFQAELSNNLSTPTRPQIVFNEGISGDRSADLDLRLDSIMERHSGANRVLMMIGTNDSGVTNPAPILPGPFGVQVSTIANAIVTDGKQVWLAEILPIIGDAARNTTIQLYNTQIRGIANLAVDDKFLGPDFYGGPVYGFNGKPFLYADTLHPNDAGYQVMANGWDATLP